MNKFLKHFVVSAACVVAGFTPAMAQQQIDPDYVAPLNTCVGCYSQLAESFSFPADCRNPTGYSMIIICMSQCALEDYFEQSDQLGELLEDCEPHWQSYLYDR